jgi:hypothetical protein
VERVKRKHFSQSLTILGRVKEILPAHEGFPKGRFVVETRGGDFTVHCQQASWMASLRNLDDLDRTRERRSKQDADGNFEQPNLNNALFVGDMVAVQGTLHTHGGNEGDDEPDKERYDGLVIHLLHSSRDHLHFEHTRWWIDQLVVMANKWLDDLFGDKRTYQLDDFAALYRTNLNILGLPTDDDTQEMATLSRLIYGLASAFLVTGDERYFQAAKAGVQFQQQAFRSYSADGRFCLWYSAIKRQRYLNRRMLDAEAGDDAGGIPLYEQIYALAGLAMYFRITGDWEVLQDIRRTICAMLTLWGHWPEADGKPRFDGFFSHIDPVTFTPRDNSLNRGGMLGPRDNREAKNWNSIGDHIPAYLMNMVLALDPLPYEDGKGDAAERRRDLEELLGHCVLILGDTARLIREHFPRTHSPLVQERFDKDWKPVENWDWQQNRGVVGHNLKIAWNLTRVGNWYQARGGADNEQIAADCYARAKTLAEDMGVLGIDQIRSGVFDALERVPPDDGLPIQFGWWSTKDFWQQEQGILAYLILLGHDPENTDFRKQAQELSAFWNLFFLDRERAGVFFRVNDNGQPLIEGKYGNIGDHSKSGYHAFELGLLAHVYQMAYLPREDRQHTVFALHFRPDADSGLAALNVAPDALAPGVLRIRDVSINGVNRRISKTDHETLRVPLRPGDLGKKVVVRLEVTEEAFRQIALDEPRKPHLPEDAPGCRNEPSAPLEADEART